MYNEKDTGRNVNDGFFQLLFQNDGVFLTVYPPAGRGRRVELREVEDRLVEKNVMDFNKELVE